jgi:hypothetical protein
MVTTCDLTKNGHLHLLSLGVLQGCFNIISIMISFPHTKRIQLVIKEFIISKNNNVEISTQRMNEIVNSVEMFGINLSPIFYNTILITYNISCFIFLLKLDTNNSFNNIYSKEVEMMSHAAPLSSSLMYPLLLIYPLTDIFFTELIFKWLFKTTPICRFTNLYFLTFLMCITYEIIFFSQRTEYLWSILFIIASTLTLSIGLLIAHHLSFIVYEKFLKLLRWSWLCCCDNTDDSDILMLIAMITHSSVFVAFKVWAVLELYLIYIKKNFNVFDNQICMDIYDIPIWIPILPLTLLPLVIIKNIMFPNNDYVILRNLDSMRIQIIESISDLVDLNIPSFMIH